MHAPAWAGGRACLLSLRLHARLLDWTGLAALANKAPCAETNAAELCASLGARLPMVDGARRVLQCINNVQAAAAGPQDDSLKVGKPYRGRPLPLAVSVSDRTGMGRIATKVGRCSVEPTCVSQSLRMRLYTTNIGIYLTGGIQSGQSASALRHDAFIGNTSSMAARVHMYERAQYLLALGISAKSGHVQ